MKIEEAYKILKSQRRNLKVPVVIKFRMSDDKFTKGFSANRYDWYVKESLAKRLLREVRK